MFTGLIEQVGSVAELRAGGDAARLTVRADYTADCVALGDSIAINGVCLTVVALGGGLYSFDASPETMQRTGFRTLKKGSPVNLERALRLSDRLGGHIVSGHVDCIALVESRRESSGSIVFSIRLPNEFARYVVAKGSVTIDGISLTVNSVSGNLFTVNVIPHTAAMTTLHSKRPGDEVNIETDILAKYVERLISDRDAGSSEGVSLETLAKNGFL